MHNDYNRTVRACFVGYVVQAIVVTYAPLLFLTFQQSYGISLSKITLLVTFNFLLQLCIDAASVKLIDWIGYRAAAVLAHAASAVGLVLLTVLPEALPDPYLGLVISVGVYAVGGGLLDLEDVQALRQQGLTAQILRLAMAGDLLGVLRDHFGAVDNIEDKLLFHVCFLSKDGISP